MDTPLARQLRDEIRKYGPMPFERFMERALYHPTHGYYASGRVEIGGDGADFITAPHLTRLFAVCLANLVEAVDRALGKPRPLTVVEGGPGEGRLARDLLDVLHQRHPELYSRLRYALDEASAALRARQEDALAPHRDRVTFALPEGVPGVYFANELVDAFPVHRVIRQRGELREVHIGVGETGLEEVLLPPSTPELEAHLRRVALEVPEGSEVEVNLRIGPWLERICGALDRGYVVTVDYGDEAGRLYGPHRPRGTCLAHRGHRATGSLLDRPGAQDLTAHVNFTALRVEGRARGLESSPLLKQREFLFALGLAAEVERPEARTGDEFQAFQTRQALAPLLLANQMGDSFKVLVQAKKAPLHALPLDPEAGLQDPP